MSQNVEKMTYLTYLAMSRNPSKNFRDPKSEADDFKMSEILHRAQCIFGQ